MLLALDVAILPPPPISRQAIELSATLPASESQGLRLGGEVLPHVTLTQQFVPAQEIDDVLASVEAALARHDALRLNVTGAGRAESSVWMTIEPTPALVQLHRDLMDVLGPFERPDGTSAAFVDGRARPGDVAWVAGFRRTSSYAAFTPHITLGHASGLLEVEPLAFDASTIAACHLSEFCTCRRVLRRWELEVRSP
jgi:2'-5' RNA ligase